MILLKNRIFSEEGENKKKGLSTGAKVAAAGATTLGLGAAGLKTAYNISKSRYEDADLNVRVARNIINDDKKSEKEYQGYLDELVDKCRKGDIKGMSPREVNDKIIDFDENRKHFKDNARRMEKYIPELQKKRQSAGRFARKVDVVIGKIARKFRK